MEKELRHFTWPVRVLKSGILQIRKKCRNPDDLRILALFSDFHNFISKYSKMASKVFLFFSGRSCADICESAKAAKWAALCMACKGTYRWNFANQKKVPES
jgi:hypothetical protein